MTVPSRSLPPHPDYDQQRKLAKELLRAHRRGDAEARARVRLHLPDKSSIVLADAQFVLAREYGFAGWAALKQHIDAASPAPLPLEALHAAIRSGDTRMVRRLLVRHAALRAQLDAPAFSFDAPALVHAAGRNDVELIDVLLEFGADPNRRSDWWAGGFHALHAATGEAAERLLAAGAVADACAAAHLDRLDLLATLIADDPSRVHQRGGDGQTPLHFARSLAAIDLLLDAGADPDARDLDHRATPAQWMLDRRRNSGRYALARYLVERGATADIFLAAALGMTDRVVAMLRADPSLLELRSSQDEYGEKPPASYHIYMWTIGADRSPLQVASQFEQTATLDAMQAIASPRQRLLAALASADVTQAHALLDARPDLLADLSPQEQRLLPDAGWAGNVRAVELMLELGFDPFATGQANGTVLHCSAWEGSAGCVAAVLRHSAATTLLAQRDPTWGATPLGWCCHGSVHGPRHGDHAAVARLLIAAGARPDPAPGDMSDAVRAIIEAA